MDNASIHYQFFIESRKNRDFIYNFKFNGAEIRQKSPDFFPAWTSLENIQCPNCPLETKKNKYCPLAVNLIDIIEKFDGLISHEKIQLIVITKERKIFRKTTVQHGMSSLMGLAIASSGCPHTSFFAPMAHFHMPLASVGETVFRAVSSYILSQYFLLQEGKKADFSLYGLRKIYKNLQIVNKATAKRLRSITASDSAVNAIILLDTFAQTLPLVMDQALDEIKKMYDQYYKAI